MTRSIAVFKNPSKLKVVLAKQVDKSVPMISKAKRGELFLRNGAVCMRVDVGKYEIELRCPEAHEAMQEELEGIEEKFAIINLQTGRVWWSADQEVEYVKAVLTVEGE